MLTFIIKHSFLISLLMLLTLFGVGLFLSSALLPLGILLVFGISIALMRQTYQAQYRSGTITQEAMRAKVNRGLAMLVVILLLTILLGIWVSGQVSGFVGNLVEVHWTGWGIWLPWCLPSLPVLWWGIQSGGAWEDGTASEVVREGIRGKCGCHGSFKLLAFLLMKRIPFLFVFSICWVLLAGCTSSFPTVVSYNVSPFAWGSNLDRDYAYALAPDGNSLVLRGLVQVNFLTGEESHPFAGYTYEDALSNPLPTSWSTDGRYIALIEASSPSFIAPAYFVDTEAKSVSRVGGDIRNFLFFSPFQDHIFIAGASTGFFMFKIEDLTPTPLGEPINYARLSGFGGTHTEAYSYLWSKELGKPVAQLELLPRLTEENTNPTTRKLYLVPYSPPTHVGKVETKNPVDTGYSVTGPTWLYYFFDPTGECVLVVELECIGDKPWQCESLDSGYFTDTIFTLIRWKTKEQKEMFRLSKIDPQHALASSLIAWSADGSTLVVGRKDASAVLLRIKYP